MSRIGRTILPDFPHHLVQRGHHRQVVFAERAGYVHHLETMVGFKDLDGVRSMMPTA